MKTLKNGLLTDDQSGKASYLGMRIISNRHNEYMTFTCRFVEYSDNHNPREHMNFSFYNFDLPKNLRGIGNIEISCQAGGQSDYRKDYTETYAHRVEFSASHAELRIIEETLPLMKRIDKSLTKIENDFGRSTKFSDYIGRIASILGVKYFHCEGMEYKYLCDVSMAKDFIDSKLRIFNEEMNPVLKQA